MAPADQVKSSAFRSLSTLSRPLSGAFVTSDLCHAPYDNDRLSLGCVSSTIYPVARRDRLVSRHIRAARSAFAVSVSVPTRPVCQIVRFPPYLLDTRLRSLVRAGTGASPPPELSSLLISPLQQGRKLLPKQNLLRQLGGGDVMCDSPVVRSARLVRTALDTRAHAARDVLGSFNLNVGAHARRGCTRVGCQIGCQDDASASNEAGDRQNASERVVSRGGIEPPTRRLRVCCSAN